MLTLSNLWLSGLIRQQWRQQLATALGIAVAVALLATLFGFFADTEASMTRQAVADVAVDWQVQLAPGADPNAATAELQRSPGAVSIAQVGYANATGFEATVGGTTQTTGPGKVLGIPDDYRTLYPAEIRDLVGQGRVLLAQQTAANLHAGPGTTVTVKRPGSDPVQITIDAVVDLPLADSLFQTVGAPAGAAPQAPPDNVLILPLDQWHALFDPVAAIDPSAVAIQLHVALDHHLPAAPTTAYVTVTGKARNYEARLAGAGVVGDNLAARLDAARSDALYARVLFFFLGLPGAVLAALLTALIVAAGATQRRRDRALLRLRGASQRQLLWLAALEAGATGFAGALLGIAIAALTVRLTFGRWSFGHGAAGTALWAGVAALVGLGLAAAVILVPAWRESRQQTVAAARRAVQRESTPLWERTGLDIVLLAASGFIYWQAKRNGYQVLLAPEGVPRVSVSYTSLFAPLLLWAGATLLTLRITRLLLARDGRLVAPLIAPIGGRLAGLVAASFGRQRTAIARSVALVALALAFAGSTAIFNATYEHQSLVDAELTNGADVTVGGNQGLDLQPYLQPIGQVAGVQAVAPLQHRFAYVGTDLQDLYGIDPATLRQAARLSDAFFVGASADQAMARLRATPDGVLVSPETVSDFQLQPGDTIKLRLQSAADHQYHPITFHYVGIAREFPTAPSDSFLVANAAYVAQQTGSAATETLLVKTHGSPAAVANRIRVLLGGASGASVRDIEAQRRVTRSSLTAVSLRGLTRLELGLAVVLALAGAGLVFALGLEERRRTLAIVSALGATPRQLGAFVWGQAGLTLLGGVLGGALLGWGAAHMLVKLLTHVFDPPPQGETRPWLYLLAVILATFLGVAVAARATARSSQRGVLETIRRL